jgi:hypothetical protein
LEASVDAEAGNPHKVRAAEQQRQAFALPGWDAGFLKEILERAARSARIGLQALAAGAKADAQRLVLERDALAARPAKAQLAAELGQPEARLAAPLLRRKRGRVLWIEKQLSPVRP